MVSFLSFGGKDRKETFLHFSAPMHEASSISDLLAFATFLFPFIQRGKNSLRHHGEELTSTSS